MASAATAQPDPSVADRVRLEIERSIQRNVKGLQFLQAGDPPVGLTPKDVIYQRGTMKLYHYRPQSEEVYRVPVLLAMSLVSKPYIMDLAPGQSLVEFLVQHGLDVYMIDWGTPRPEDKRLKLEDYVLDFIPDCLERVVEDSGEPDVSLVGYCMGGQLVVMYQALHPDGPVKNLGCFTTPIDSTGMTLFKRWTDPRYFDVDRIVDSLGNVPPDLLYASFEMLKPAQQMAKRIKLWDNMWNDDFVRSFRLFDRWAQDQIPFPGETFRQFTKGFMWENKLVKNEFELAGRRVDLGNITVPTLHVMAQHDHIVPYESGKALIPMVGSEDKQEMVLKGGHVSLVAGGNAVYRLWPQLESWLGERSQ